MIRTRERVAAGLAGLLLVTAGCALPGGPKGPPPREFLLSADFAPAASTSGDAPVLVVGRPRASAGFGSPDMVYVKDDDELRAFAHSRWADTPGAMLQPLLVDALQATGAFRAVVDGAAGFGGGWRLDTRVLALKQDFSHHPSSVSLVLRATLVNARDGQVAFARTFSAVETAPSDDPEGGVAAANQAAKDVLSQIAQSVAEAIR